MPWYTYVCEKCGERVQQKASLAYREVMPVHRNGGCGDGRLKRLMPALGPTEAPRTPTRRLAAVLKDGPAGAAVRAVEARPGDDGRSERGIPGMPAGRPPELGRAWEDCIIDALSSITTESMSAPRGMELIRRLLATLPTLSLKLRLVETVARAGRSVMEATSLGEALAEEVAAAPVEALARERRLLDLLLLAKRYGKLDVRDVGERLDDDRVMVRLLRSAIRWTALDGGDDDAADPPVLAWSELRQLAGASTLRARILRLAALPGAGDTWDRLVIEVAAKGEPGLVG